MYIKKIYRLFFLFLASFSLLSCRSNPFEPDDKFVSISFVCFGTESSESFQKGSIINLDDFVPKLGDNYKFYGWFYDSYLTKRIKDNFYPVTKDAKIYAKIEICFDTESDIEEEKKSENDTNEPKETSIIETEDSDEPVETSNMIKSSDKTIEKNILKLGEYISFDESEDFSLITANSTKPITLIAYDADSKIYSGYFLRYFLCQDFYSVSSDFNWICYYNDTIKASTKDRYYAINEDYEKIRKQFNYYYDNYFSLINKLAKRENLIYANDNGEENFILKFSLKEENKLTLILSFSLTGGNYSLSINSSEEPDNFIIKDLKKVIDYKLPEDFNSVMTTPYNLSVNTNLDNRIVENYNCDIEQKGFDIYGNIEGLYKFEFYEEGFDANKKRFLLWLYADCVLDVDLDGKLSNSKSTISMPSTAKNQNALVLLSYYDYTVGKMVIIKETAIFKLNASKYIEVNGKKFKENSSYRYTFDSKSFQVVGNNDIKIEENLNTATGTNRSGNGGFVNNIRLVFVYQNYIDKTIRGDNNYQMSQKFEFESTSKNFSLKYLIDPSNLNSSGRYDIRFV